MGDAHVMIDHLPGMSDALLRFLEDDGHVVDLEPIRYHNFKLLVRVHGKDPEELDSFLDGELRFAPGVYTIEQVDGTELEEDDRLRSALDALDAMPR